MKFKLFFLILILPGLVSANLIITEVFPNPKGSDKALAPNGEWVELFNLGNEPITVSNCSLLDGEKVNGLQLQGTIPPKSYKIFYRNLNNNFNLNNEKDKVRLVCNSKLIDKIEYSDSIEGLTKALFNNKWVNQIPTPGKENYKKDFSNICDWQINFEFESLVSEQAYWKNIVSKNYGEKNKLIITREIRDLNDNIIKRYNNLTVEASFRKSIPNQPRLEPGIYSLYASIISLNCIDQEKENNNLTQLFYIKAPNETIKPQDLNIINQFPTSNKTKKTKENNLITLYESKNKILQKYTIYFFCFVQTLIIFIIKVEKK